MKKIIWKDLALSISFLDEYIPSIYLFFRGIRNFLFVERMEKLGREKLYGTILSVTFLNEYLPFD